MADKEPQQTNSTQLSTQNTFTGGMVKDPLELYQKADTYSYARNMVNVLPDGGAGGKSAEPSNIPAGLIPYTPIGFIFLSDGDFWVASTNNVTSEIGIYNNISETYTTLMNDAATIAAGLPGLNFSTKHLITGGARRGFDCGFDVYWSDGAYNFDRTINTATCPWDTANNLLTPNPWIQNCTPGPGCIICVNTDIIDSEQLRLAPLMNTPCLKLSKHKGSGQLLNGSYQVFMAFAVNSIKCTDYIAYSDVYSLWSHVGVGGSFNLSIEGISDATKIRFTEMELVVVSMVNRQVIAKRLGIYSTAITSLTIDNINEELVTIPLDRLLLSNPIIPSSDAIFPLSNYLTRVGTYERPEFNYQPLANLINTYYAAVEYPEDYYQKGGNEFGMNVSYLRGENYALYIRWLYNTGDKSASYVIPARSVPTPNTSPTLSITGLPSVPGGTVIAAGRTGVYVSQEIYPDHSPAVWGPLCGQNIMWHRMPDQSDFSGNILSHFNPRLSSPPQGTPSTISVLGLYFDNIVPPVDINGNIIPDIVGYEILRAVRDGHESIIAKGQVNHMRGYINPDGSQGLYQNYPYDDLHQDYYLTSNQDIGTIGPNNPRNDPNQITDPLTIVHNDIVSFHSPDTVFDHPFLGQGQLELVQANAGTAVGNFKIPYLHPKFKALTDTASIMVDIASGLISAINSITLLSGGATNLQLGSTQDIPLNIPMGIAAPYEGPLGALAVTEQALVTIFTTIINILLAPIQFRALQGQLMNTINGLAPARQYATQYNSHGYYSTPVHSNRAITDINDYQYIKGNIQSFAGYNVNNLYRNDYVILQLNRGIPDFPAPYNFTPNLYNYFGHVGNIALPPFPQCDYSRFTLSQFYGSAIVNINDTFYSPIVSWYGVYRVPQVAQYGQIDSTKQVPIGCIQQVNVNSTEPFASPVMFGGDTYINRYTEKNPMLFFNDWLIDQPSDYYYDYTNYENVPYPRYWFNNSKIYADFLSLAHRNYHLDEYVPSILDPLGLVAGFYVKSGYFYLFNNGVRDFFVESSVNVGYRDYEDEIAKRFYDPYGYTNTEYLFRSDIIKSNILYKYDYSLSANRFINQYISWSQCLRRDYSPELAYSCFAYYPHRLVYSLPQEEEQIQDNWRIFLPNNYKDFDDKVTVVKDLHKNGAMFLMESSIPMELQGVATMPSKNGAEYTVGTGLLFEQALQSIGNVDDSYEYASCQSKLGVINTPYGVYWISQSTGKAFHLAGGQVTDIGQEAGMKFHLLQYLPSKLLQLYPQYPYPDNPVDGVGCQLIYDSLNEVLYICKKDYTLIDRAPGSAVPILSLDSTGFYYLQFGIKVYVLLTDTTFFQECSWTLSYDCRKKEFISWHDWYPSLHVPAKDHFITTNKLSGNLWRHNTTIQSFANFYGNDYPVEIEYLANTQVTTSILQSVEWLLESYQYTGNATDRFLNYDNGDMNYIMLWNKEQNSTLQQMTLKPWNNPYSELAYPQFIGSQRNVLYSRVEGKCRVNQFTDYTKDRGQFSIANTVMFNTDPNGYTRSLNPNYFNLSKSPLQQKRMRYTGTNIFMRKTLLGNNSLTLRYCNTKNIYSPR